MWLGLFGKALNFGSFISSQGGNCLLNKPRCLITFFGVTSYFSFLSVGMLSFIILFTAAFAGMSVVWDRRFGFMNKALSTPVGRGAIVIGKILQSVVRSLVQAVLVLIIAIALGMDTSHLTVLNSRRSVYDTVLDGVRTFFAFRDAGAQIERLADPDGNNQPPQSATVVCEQCDAPDFNNARMASNSGETQPSELRERCDKTDFCLAQP